MAAVEMGIDAFAIDGEPRQLFLHRLEGVEAGLAHIEQRGADQHVGEGQVALDEGEGRVAMQRGAHEHRRLRVAMEHHVFPRHQHIVEDDERVDLVEAAGNRIVLQRPAPGETCAADELQAGRTEIADEAHRIVGDRAVAPVGDGRLGEGLIGIGSGRLVLRATHDDPGIRFLHDMQQHVGILLLRRPRAIALGIGVGRHVERVAVQHPVDVIADVRREARVHLVQHVLPVEQRPHLADGLVADTGDGAARLVQHAVGRAALVPPVFLGDRQLVGDAVDLPVLGEGHHVLGARIELHVVDARAHIDQRLEHGVGRHVLHPLAVDIDLTPLADRPRYCSPVRIMA